MTDDCAFTRFELALLRRNELDPPEAERVRQHLAACPECAAELAVEQRLDQALAGTRELAAPAELRDAVRRLIARERRPRWRDRWNAVSSWTARPWVAAALGAAAAVLVLAPTVLVLQRRLAEPVLVVPLTEAATGYRRAAMQREVLGLVQEDVAQVVAALRQRYGLPTTTTFHGDAELRLVAVRPTVVLGRPGALFVFADAAGRLVTLQIVRAPEITVPRQETTQVESFRPLVTERDHLSIALWKQADALYTLSAETDRAELARLFIKVRRGTTNPS